MKLVTMPDANGREVAINVDHISTVRAATTKDPVESTLVQMTNGEKIYLSLDFKSAIRKLK